MQGITRPGRILFGLGLIGLGLDQFIFREFVVGRAPAWPESIPGGPAWAYITGAIFVAVGATILAGRKARAAAVLAASLVFVWALLRHLPVVASSGLFSGEWTQAGKALRFVGGALAVAATLPLIEGRRDTALSRFMNLRRPFIVAGRICLGLTLILNGVQHFLFTEFVASLIPGWFPGDAVFWTRFAGVALIAGGTGLLLPRTAAWASLLSGLMVFSWFWIIHVPRAWAFLTVSDRISVFEALVTAGTLFVIAGFSSHETTAGNDQRRASRAHEETPTERIVKV